MQENPQTIAGQERLKQAFENKSEKPEVLVREMLRQGDVQVTDILSWIADQEEIADKENDMALMEELGDIKKSVNAAYAKLRAGLEQAKKQAPETTEEIDQGWGEAPAEAIGTPDTSKVDEGWGETSTEADLEFPRDAWTEALDALDKALVGEELPPGFDKLLEEAEGEKAFRQVVSDKLFSELIGETTNFATLDKLLKLGESGPRANQIMGSEFREVVGSKAWEKIKKDEAYRKELENIQTALSRTVGGKEQPLCRELGLDRLVLLREMFGSEAAEIADKVNLATHCPELEMSSGEILVAPTLDKESGLITGNVSMFYDYGDEQDAARMHRRFSSRLIKGDGGYATEKSTDLELITLPNKLKGKNTAKQEMAATNEFLKQQGFDKEKLHANIDIGGYTWATLGFGWDVEKMRRQDQKEKSDLEIVTEFTRDRINVVRKNLRDSGINPEDPDIKEHLGPIEKKLEDMAAGALITPQELAAMGKNGTKFIRAESGKLYRSQDYEKYREEDPPAAGVKGEQHLGKLLLIGSDWYGQKQL